MLLWMMYVKLDNTDNCDKKRLVEYCMDGLPSDNGAFGFFKPLLWAAAGDTLLNVHFLFNWLLPKQILCGAVRSSVSCS